jgi:hypothetical protein
MDAEIIAEPNPGEKVIVSTPIPRAWWGKIVYGLYVIVMPIFAFWATDLIKPEWQSGELSDYIILLLFPEASWIFFLLLAYSVICYVLLLISPDRYAQFFSFRFGVYTGALLALQYSVLSSLYFLSETPNPSFILLWIFPLVYAPLYRWAVTRWNPEKVNRFLFIAAIGMLLIAIMITRTNMILLVILALTIAAPFWSFLLAISTAFWLFKNYETRISLPRGLGLASWVAAYAAAWRFDILKMYELYAALPPQPPPDCYIATAAARGHPWLVGSWLVQRANGESMHVNRQLQILKCAELALMAVQPRLHRMLRRAYDIFGRSLAQGMRNPFLSDAAYLLLKPWDRLARCGLKIMIPEIDSIANQMYRN